MNPHKPGSLVVKSFMKYVIYIYTLYTPPLCYSDHNWKHKNEHQRNDEKTLCIQMQSICLPPFPLQSLPLLILLADSTNSKIEGPFQNTLCRYFSSHISCAPSPLWTLVDRKEPQGVKHQCGYSKSIWFCLLGDSNCQDLLVLRFANCIKGNAVLHCYREGGVSNI